MSVSRCVSIPTVGDQSALKRNHGDVEVLGDSSHSDP